MARLIFCHFAEDTDICNGHQPAHGNDRADERAGDSSNIHEVIGDVPGHEH
jgi:hypothetical protein